MIPAPPELPDSRTADPGGILGAAGRPFLSSEVLPPSVGDPSLLEKAASALLEKGARLLFIPDSPRGSVRVGSLAAASFLAERMGRPCVPHLNCRDRNRVALEVALATAAFLGIRGLKAVTGDPLPIGAAGVYELSSVELVAAARGRADLSATLVVGHTLGTLDARIAEERLHQKLEAGAHLVVTTPTLDAAAIDEVLQVSGRHQVPVVVSLTLIPSHEVLDYLCAEMPGFRVPEAMQTRLRSVSSKEAAMAASLDACMDVVSALKTRVLGFHVVPPFGRAEAAIPLLEALQVELA